MREIEFRGKRDDGEWLFGSLVDFGDFKCIWSVDADFFKLVDRDRKINPEYIVDPKTIGQYTGAKANFKKEIYEGDILSIFDPTNEQSIQAVVVFGLGCLSVCENGDARNGTQTLLFIHCEEKTITIIGNIHDPQTNA